MHTDFIKAKQLFEANDYKQAKLLFGLCSTLPDTQISSEEKKASLYMLMWLHVCNYDLKTALIYYKNIGNDSFKSKLLPGRAKHQTVLESFIAALEQATKHNLRDLDLSQSNINGNNFKRLMAALQKQHLISSIKLNYEKLSLNEIKVFLKWALARSTPTRVDLSGLKLTKEILDEIVSLMKENPPNVNSNKSNNQLEIVISNIDQSCDIKPILQKLKRDQGRLIKLTVANSSKKITYVSEAIKQEENRKNKTDSIVQLESFNKQLRDNLELVLKTNKLEHEKTPNTIITLKSNNIESADYQKILYDKDGNLSAYVINKGGKVTVYVPDSIEFLLADPALFDPCVSLAIHGGNSTVVIRNHFQISVPVRIFSKVLKLESDSILKAPSIFLDTQQQVIINGVVDTSLLSINGSLESNAKVTFNKNSVIQTKNITVNGKNVALEGLVKDCHSIELLADCGVSLNNQSVTIADKITIKSAQAQTRGNVQCESFRCESAQTKLGGAISTRLKHYDKSMQSTFVVESTACEIDGKCTIDDSLSIISDKLFITTRGKIEASEQALDKNSPSQQSSYSVIKCKDRLYVDQQGVIKRPNTLDIQTQDFTLLGKITSTDNIHLEINGTGEINDHAEIHAGKSMVLEGSACWNSGDIHAEEMLSLAFDRFFVNGICDHCDPIARFKEGQLLGKLSAKNISATSAFFLGLLSNITADNAVQINSFIEVNVGLMNAKNITHSNILAVDLGASITAVKSIKSVIDFMRNVVCATKSDGQEVKSLVKEYYDTTDGKTIALDCASYVLKLAGIASKLIVVLAPQVGVPLSLVMNAASLFYQLAMNGINLKQELAKLVDRCQSGKPIRPRDIYSLILSTKNIAVASISATNFGISMPAALDNLSNQVKNSHEDMFSVLPSVAGLFAGSVAEQSVVDLHGASVTVTGMSNQTSAFNFAAFHHSVTGTQFENSLINSQAYSTNIAAMRSISSQGYSETKGHHVVKAETILTHDAHIGGQTQVAHMTLVTNHLEQEGATHLQTAILAAKEAQVQGSLVVASGAIKIDKLEQMHGAEISVSNASVKINEAHLNSGTTNLNEVVAEIKELQQEEHNTLNVNNSKLDTERQEFNGKAVLTHAEIINQGQSNVNGELTANDCDIKKGNIIFEQGSKGSVKACVVDVAHVEEKKGAQVDISNCTVKTERATLEGSGVISENTVINCDHATISDQRIVDSAVIAKDSATFVQNSHSTLENSGVKATNIIQEKANELNMNNTSVEAVKLDVSGNAQLTNASVLKGEAIDLKGGVALDNSQLQGQRLDLQNGSTTKLVNSDVLVASVHKHEGAILETKNEVCIQGTDAKIDGEVQVDGILQIEESNQASISQSGRINGVAGSASEVNILAPHITQDGNIHTNKAGFQGEIDSKDVGKLLRKETNNCDEIKIITTKAVEIKETATGAKDVTIVAAAINDNAKQVINSLTLKSTVGDVTLNKGVIAQNLNLISDEGRLYVNASTNGAITTCYAKNGIQLGTLSKENSSNNLFAKIGLGTKKIYQVRRSDFATSILENKDAHKSSSYSALFDIGKKGTNYADGKITMNGVTILLESGKDITLNGSKVKGSTATFIAEGSIILNRNNQLASRAQISGDNIDIHAANVYNNGQVIVGGYVYFDLTNNLYNIKQGKITASHFLSVQAENVYNRCQINRVGNQYGVHDEYLSSILQGGDGKGMEDNTGLYVHTRGELVNDASLIRSVGSNYILADKGVRTTARSNTFTSYKKDEESFFGLNQKHEERKDTNIGRSGITSLAGKNTIICEQGKLYSVATDFIAAKGTYLYARDGQEFYDIVGFTETKKSSRDLGLFYSNEASYDEFSSPTYILDDTGIFLESEQNIRMRGTEIVTPGQLDVIAKNFDFTISKLNHNYHNSSFGISATLCNQNIGRFHNSYDYSQPIWSVDPAKRQFDQLSKSKGAIETALNSWSAAIECVNTANSFMNAWATNSLYTLALNRGLPSLCAPQLGINFTHSETSTSDQTLGKGGIFAGSANFQVENTVRFKGASIKTLKDFLIDCQNLIIEGEDLNYKSDQKTQNVNFTISAIGGSCQAGVNVSDTQSAGTAHANSQLQVDGTLTVNAKNMVIDAATVYAGKIKGEIDNLTIKSETDTAHSHSTTMGASSCGSVSFATSTTDSALVSAASGIHTKESINGNADELIVHQVVSEGGQVTSEKVCNFKADTVEAKDVEEFSRTSGFSVSGNVKNLVTPSKPANNSPENHLTRQIPTSTIGIQKNNYKANNKAVIHGLDGTSVRADNIKGDVKTESVDGKEVTENKSHNYNVVVPHIDAQIKHELEQEAKWVATKAAELDKKIEKCISNLFKPAVAQRDGSYVLPEKDVKGHPEKKITFHPKDVKKENKSPASKEYADCEGSKNKDKSVDRDAIKEAYLNGKIAATTGNMPTTINDYPPEIQASFYQGYYDSKAVTTGGVIALAGLVIAATGGALAAMDFAAGGVLSDLASVGLRTFGLFKKTSNVAQEVIKSLEGLVEPDQIVNSDLLTSNAQWMEDTIQLIMDYLGEGFTVLKPGPNKSDLILTSADRTKVIRFDLLYSHGYEPHINFETYKCRNLYPGDKERDVIKNLHFFPKNDLKLEKSDADTNNFSPK